MGGEFSVDGELKKLKEGADLDWGFSVDIEVTNRCNAKCHFCPRDQTPHQGLMTPEVFAQSVERAIEFSHVFPDRGMLVVLCGLGEPLLNRNCPKFVCQVREAGFTCWMSSNGSLLDETRSKAVLDAGLQKISINVGERDEDYEQVYKLPFHKTRDNILRFAEMARDYECDVEIVLVDHRSDKDHIKGMEDYWRERGIEQFLIFSVMNRGGALFVDHMQFETYQEIREAKELLDKQALRPICGVPFRYLFIGYDGQYYLCCSDWKKEVPLGSVFHESFASIGLQKLQHVTSREPICKTCNHDPTNKLTEELRSINEGDGNEESKDRLIAELNLFSRESMQVLEGMNTAANSVPVAIPDRVRRRIRLTSQ